MMSALTVERSVRAQVDHFAGLKSACETALRTLPANSLNAFVDESDDPPYRQRLNRAVITRLQSSLTAAQYGNIGTWIDSHEAYFDSVGMVDLVSAFEVYHASFPGEFAELYRASTGRQLTAATVWPYSYRRFGSWVVGSSAISSLSSETLTPNTAFCRGEGAIRVESLTRIGASNLNLAISLVRAAGTTYSWTPQLASGSPANTEVGLRRSISGSVSGTTIVSDVDPSTFGLAAGQWVILRSVSTYGYSHDALVEAAKVSTIVPNSPNWTLTVDTAFVNTYGSTFYLEPCWAGVSTVAYGSGGTDGDRFTVYFAPDRGIDRGL